MERGGLYKYNYCTKSNDDMTTKMNKMQIADELDFYTHTQFISGNKTYNIDDKDDKILANVFQ